MNGADAVKSIESIHPVEEDGFLWLAGREIMVGFPIQKWRRDESER